MCRQTILVILVIGFFVLFSGCHDGCEPEETKCDGDMVMVCNSAADWEQEADCSEIEDFGVGIEWTCCVDPEDGVHACLPVEVCVSVDGGV